MGRYRPPGVTDVEDETKPSLIARLFPQMPDFRRLLLDQAEQAQASLHALREMLEADKLDVAALYALEEKADALRSRNARRLSQAFATSYDREDIARTVEQLDWIVAHTLATGTEMHALNVTVDDAIRELTDLVHAGVGDLVEALRLIDEDDDAARAACSAAQAADRAARRRYEAGLSELFRSGDPIEIMRRREVYHHLKDAAKRVFEAAVILDTIRVKNV